jgi:hypothetical protein
MWTCFFDVRSGGGLKLDWQHIFIQADEETACRIFEEKFGRNPHNVTCECCGEDYAITEDTDLFQVTGFERNCKYDKTAKKYVESPGKNYVMLADYLQCKEVKFVFV